MYNNELTHYGVLGMKWGVRRTPAQLGRSKSGSSKKSTSSGKLFKKKKVNKPPEVQKQKPKKLSELTDSELRERIARLELEKRYRDLSPQKNADLRDRIDRLELERRYSNLQPEKKGFVKSTMSEVVAPAAKDAGKRVLTDWLTKKGKEALGLNAEPAKDYTAELKKEVQKMNLEKQYRNLKAEAEQYAKSQATKTQKGKPQETKSKSSDNRTEESKLIDDLWGSSISQAETRQYIALGERRIAGLLPERSSASRSR